MGGLLKAPKPVVVTAAAPAPAPVVAPATVEAAAQTARLDNQDRGRRGLAGTIATSERGVLGVAANTGLAPAGRKNLLGE